MFGRSTAAVRVLAVAIAMALGLSSGTAFAQDTSAPDGFVDTGQVAFASEDELSQLIVVVVQFEDASTAEAAIDTVTEEFTATLAADAAEEPIELTDVEGLDGIGDQATAYGLTYQDGVDITYLVVLDGVFVHIYGLAGADPSAVAAATPGATPDATPAAEGTPGAAGAPVEVLVGVAETVIGEGSAEGATLADVLPTVDDVPAGYTETDRQESLNG